MNQTAFINSVKGEAMQGQKESGILASMTIAQAILESGWGESALTKLANNLFGIKRWGYPEFVTMETNEWINGAYEKVNAEFRKYSSWSDSIKDHTKFLIDNSRYANLKGVKEYKTACTLIREDGYATDPAYTDSLIRLIEENKLYEFDNPIVYVPISQPSKKQTWELNQHGDIIKRLQNELNVQFGANLTVDGWCGDLTMNFIKAHVTIRQGANGNITRIIQEILVNKGYNPHGIDGSFGPGTLAAVEQFQRAKGLSVDGLVGPQTWTKLLSL